MAIKLGYILTTSDNTKYFFADLKALTEWMATESVTTQENVYGVTVCNDKLDGSHIDCCFYKAAKYEG